MWTSNVFPVLVAGCDALPEGCHKCDIANVARRFVLWPGRRPRPASDDHVDCFVRLSQKPYSKKKGLFRIPWEMMLELACIMRL